MNVEYHREAISEAREAALYIDERRPGFGKVFRDEIDAAVSFLSREPRIWRVRRFGYRRYVTVRFKYQIWYRERGDLIYIIAVHHSSRKPDYWRKRI